MKRYLIILLAMLVFAISFPSSAFAAANDIVAPSEFNGLSGDGEYLGSDYRDNYYLDIEKLGILDTDKSLMNGIANILFSFMHMLVYLTVVIFFHGMGLDLGSLFGTAINGIQSGLVDVIFNTLFFLALAASLGYMGYQIYKQNLEAAINELLKVVAILVISTGVTLYSSQFLTFVNTTTKAVSVAALGELSEQSLSYDNSASINTYAANAAGVLWGNMLHQPWVSLEFYGSSREPNSGEIDDILSEPIGSDAREQAVSDLNSSIGAFKKEVGGNRIGFSLILIILTIAKAAVFLAITALQLGFQIFTMILIFLCPLILLLAIPVQVFGGLKLIDVWLKKILETQISILILSFVIGLIVKFDSLLYTLSPTYGWLIVLLLQAMILVGIMLNHKAILQLFSKIQKGIQNPNYIRRQMMRAGNLYEPLASGGHMRPAIAGAGAGGGHSGSRSQHVSRMQTNTATYSSERASPSGTRQEIQEDTGQAQPLPDTPRQSQTANSGPPVIQKGVKADGSGGSGEAIYLQQQTGGETRNRRQPGYRRLPQEAPQFHLVNQAEVERPDSAAVSSRNHTINNAGVIVTGTDISYPAEAGHRTEPAISPAGQSRQAEHAAGAAAENHSRSTRRGRKNGREDIEPHIPSASLQAVVYEVESGSTQNHPITAQNNTIVVDGTHSQERTQEKPQTANTPHYGGAKGTRQRPPRPATAAPAKPKTSKGSQMTVQGYEAENAAPKTAARTKPTYKDSSRFLEGEYREERSKPSWLEQEMAQEAQAGGQVNVELPEKPAKPPKQPKTGGTLPVAQYAAGNHQSGQQMNDARYLAYEPETSDNPVNRPGKVTSPPSQKQEAPKKTQQKAATPSSSKRMKKKGGASKGKAVKDERQQRMRTDEYKP